MSVSVCAVDEKYERNRHMTISYIDNGLTDELLVHFRNQVGWGKVPLDQASKAIRNTPFSIVAYDADKAVGIGRLVGDGALIWYIQDLIVLPEYQNNRIGSSIMNRLIDFAAQNSVPDSVTTFGLMSAKGKELFYQKFGFRTRPNDKEGSGMVMGKKV